MLPITHLLACREDVVLLWIVGYLPFFDGISALLETTGIVFTMDVNIALDHFVRASAGGLLGTAFTLSSNQSSNDVSQRHSLHPRLKFTHNIISRRLPYLIGDE